MKSHIVGHGEAGWDFLCGARTATCSKCENVVGRLLQAVEKLSLLPGSDELVAKHPHLQRTLDLIQRLKAGIR
jgi:hypothetical protein